MLPLIVCAANPATGWDSLWTDPVRLTQFAANVGLFAGGITAALTLWFVGKRTVDHHWNESFRTAFEAFWGDGAIAQARWMVDYDAKYNELKPTLLKLIEKGGADDYSDDEIARIEALDRFCAAMAGIRFYGTIPFLKRDRNLFDAILINHWIDQIASREELRAYIEKFWPNFPLNRLSRRVGKPRR